MAVTVSVYNKARLQLATKKIDLSADTIKVLLTSSVYVPNVDTHSFLTDVTNELAGSGYGRQTLANKTVTQNNALDKAIFTSDPADFLAAGGTITARRAVLFHDTGVAGTSELLCCVDFGADLSAIDATKLRVGPDATNGWLFL